MGASSPKECVTNTSWSRDHRGGRMEILFATNTLPRENLLKGAPLASKIENFARHRSQLWGDRFVATLRDMLDQACRERE